MCDGKNESMWQKEWEYEGVCVKALWCMHVRNQMRKKCVLDKEVAIIHKDTSKVKII